MKPDKTKEAKEMAKAKWFRFTFEDGYWFEARGLDRTELAAEIRVHGQLVSKEPVEVW